ncbi:17105_t:CDS:2, partial [Gigaspora rosea]
LDPFAFNCVACASHCWARFLRAKQVLDIIFSNVITKISKLNFRFGLRDLPLYGMILRNEQLAPSCECKGNNIKVDKKKDKNAQKNVKAQEKQTKNQEWEKKKIKIV